MISGEVLRHGLLTIGVKLSDKLGGGVIYPSVLSFEVCTNIPES
jgi:hypothetical protein